MKRLLTLTIAATTLFITAPSIAGDTTHDRTITHVVELFTSQGCSSCPPANKTVTKIAEDEGMLALSYGVTYWDYLGWKDTFGDPKFTQRQRDYQEAMDGANLYTPQIILNGSSHSPRFSSKDIRSMALAKSPYEANIAVKNDHFVISGNVPAGGVLAFVEYEPGTQDVAVKRGENRGRTLRLANVVTDIVTVNWIGRSMTLSETPRAGKHYAALFHDPNTAKIITAAQYTP